MGPSVNARSLRREIVRGHFYSAAFFGLVIGLAVSLTAVALALAAYGDIWFASGAQKLLFAASIIGQYCGTILLINLLCALFMALVALKLEPLVSRIKPRIFYTLLGLYVQTTFWAELVNVFAFHTEKDLLTTKISCVAILLAMTVFFGGLYIWLSRFERTDFEPSGFSKAVSLTGSALLLLMFAVSFVLPLDPNMAAPQVPQPFENMPFTYDSEGTFLGELGEGWSPKYNVMLVSLDTLRADSLGCYGAGRPVSPFLDELAMQGMLFERVRAISSWTLPSHGTMLTSLYPTEHGGLRRTENFQNFDVVRSSNATLPEILQKAGYHTAAFTGGGWMTEQFGFGQGFDLFNPSEGNPMETVIPFLEGYDGEKPWFVLLHTFKVHNYSPSPKYAEMFSDTALAPMRERILLRYFQRSHNNKGYFTRHPDHAEYLRGLYDATIREVDDQFASVVGTLRDRGMFANTIFVITSDHGEEFWEHSGTGHGRSYYDDNLLVPLIFVLPEDYGLTAGRVAQEATLLDITPTILDLLGLPGKVRSHGISLVPAMRGEKTEPRKYYIEACTWGNRVGMVDGPYKFIFNQLPPVEKRILFSTRFAYPLNAVMKYSGNELYDTHADPAERNNLADSEAMRMAAMERDALNHLLTGIQAYVHPEEGPAAVLDEKTLEELRALGYLH